MSCSLMNDSEANNQFARMLKELNLSPEIVPIWWVDMVIVSITDSWACCVKKRGKTTRQAVHLSLGQIKCVGRATFVMWAMSYFLSAEWLQAILQEFIIYQTGWYPLWQNGSGWSLTPLGLPGELRVSRDVLASNITLGLPLLSLNWSYRW